jgi:hypothetical protein
MRALCGDGASVRKPVYGERCVWWAVGSDLTAQGRLWARARGPYHTRAQAIYAMRVSRAESAYSCHWSVSPGLIPAGEEPPRADHPK